MRIKQIINSLKDRKLNLIKGQDPSCFLAGKEASKIISCLNSDEFKSKDAADLDSMAMQITKLSHSEFTLIARLNQDNQYKIETIAGKVNRLNKTQSIIQPDCLPVLMTEGRVYNANPQEILSQAGINSPKTKAVNARLLRDHETNLVGVVFCFVNNYTDKSSILIQNTLNLFAHNLTFSLMHIKDQET